MKQTSIILTVFLVILLNNITESKKVSIKKCCELDQWYFAKNYSCTSSNKTFEPNVYNIDDATLNYEIIKLNASEQFNIEVEIVNCTKVSSSLHVVRSERHEVILLKNGSLFLTYGKKASFTYEPDKYCIDNFKWNENKVEVNALVCHPNSSPNENDNYRLNSTCMFISCFFIVLTVAVYAWLPELRTLHGMFLIAYLLCFMASFVFLGIMQIKTNGLRSEVCTIFSMFISCFFIVLTVAVYAWLPELRTLHGMFLIAYLLCFMASFVFLGIMQIKSIGLRSEVCTIFTFIVYFSLLSAFFWLNVMCYDMWWTFSGNRTRLINGVSSLATRFCYYSLYAFGVPLLLTILLAALEFGIGNKPETLLPNIRLQTCFLFGNSKLLYLYVPITLLCVANMVFFILSAMKIAKVKNESEKVLGIEKNKHRFWLYIKLFSVMGVSWILEVVSAVYPKAECIWMFTDAYNALVGLIVFIVFVCKAKTLKMIKHRFRLQILRSGTQTTTTTTTSTSMSTRKCSCVQSRDELGMFLASPKKF